MKRIFKVVSCGDGFWKIKVGTPKKFLFLRYISWRTSYSCVAGKWNEYIPSFNSAKRLAEMFAAGGYDEWVAAQAKLLEMGQERSFEIVEEE